VQTVLHEPGYSNPSVDHLIGAREQGRSDAQPEFTRCLQVDGKFETRGRLYRQVRRRLAFQDAGA